MLPRGRTAGFSGGAARTGDDPLYRFLMGWAQAGTEHSCWSWASLATVGAVLYYCSGIRVRRGPLPYPRESETSVVTR